MKFASAENHVRIIAIAALAVLLSLVLLPLASCGSSGRIDPSPTAESGAGVSQASPERSGAASGDRPVALVAGEPVYGGDLGVWMSELAGGVVLEEMAVSRQVRRELETRGMTLTQEDIQSERRNMAVATDHQLTDAELAAAMKRVQQVRGLGPARFKATLERNAGLRRLVRDEVRVGEDDVKTEMALKYGPRTRVRIIVTPAESDAITARARIEATPVGERSRRFAEEAALVSFDPSAARGGEIEPLSAADANYALAVRQALVGMSPGDLSPIIALENGYAILLCEGSVEPSTPPKDAEELARARVRLQAERLAMERLARRLLQSASVTVFDRSLDWSWNARRGQER